MKDVKANCLPVSEWYILLIYNEVTDLTLQMKKYYKIK